MSKKILNPDASYTFQDYFLLATSFLTQEIVSELGYKFDEQPLILPQTSRTLEHFPALEERIRRTSKNVGLSNETARRETLIAPILLDTSVYTNSLARIEYAVEVTPQLKGILDYYLKSQNNLLVVEAKDGDLRRGFAQLAAELIAFDVADETPQNLIYGAVTTGEEWRFGRLDRAGKIITQDENFYNVPQNLEILSKILVGILED